MGLEIDRALVLATGLALSLPGCLGDCIGRNTADREAAVADTDPTPPSEPCPAYLQAVTRLCNLELDGHLSEHRCHAEIVRVMNLYTERRDPHSPRGDPRPEAEVCTRYLDAMPAPEGDPRLATLGPSCRAWAEEIRERCVVPLSSIPPALERCGPDLLAFESTLGAIVFGRAEDHEPQCADAVRRLDSE